MGEGFLTAHFGWSLAERLAYCFKKADHTFPSSDFYEAVGDLDPHGLMKRVERLGGALAEVLPSDPESAWARMQAVLPEPLGPEGKTFNDGYWMLPLAAYWPLAQLKNYQVAAVALPELTKRGTSEFAIRPFLEKYPEYFATRLQAWVSDPSFYVRRLASEGSRPKLPWKGKLKVSSAQSLHFFEVIGCLATDSSRYVRRSVGNHARDVRQINNSAVEAWLKSMNPPADVCKLAASRTSK